MADMKIIEQGLLYDINAAYWDNGFYPSKDKTHNYLDVEHIVEDDYLLMAINTAFEMASEFNGVIYGSSLYKTNTVSKLIPRLSKSSALPKDLNIIFKNPSDQKKFIDKYMKFIQNWILDINQELAKLKDSGYKIRIGKLPTEQTKYTDDIIWENDPTCIKDGKIIIDTFNPEKVDSQFKILTIDTKSAKTYGTLTNPEFANFVLDKITLKKNTKIVAYSNDPSIIHYYKNDFE